MFYCDDCRKKNGWPESFMGSRGRCEVCGMTANCHDTPSSALPDRKPEKEVPKMTPPDLDRCQTERPNGNSFMTFGGKVGMARCSNKPIVIARERAATHADGEIGEMSLCAHCMNKMIEQMGDAFADFRAIERDGEDKGVQS